NRRRGMMAASSDSVLITVLNGQRLLDAGTGTVICHKDGLTYILTCAHNLKARRQRPDGGFSAEIKVSGQGADCIADPQLELADLALLTVRGTLGVPAKWTKVIRLGDRSTCEGFVRFFQHEFVPKRVAVELRGIFKTHIASGEELSYLQLEGKFAQECFY